MGAFDIITGWYRPPAGTTFAGAVLHILGHFFLPSGFSEAQQSSRPFGIRTKQTTRCLMKTILILTRQPSNHSMKPTAPWRRNFRVLATTPWISLGARLP